MFMLNISKTCIDQAIQEYNTLRNENEIYEIQPAHANSDDLRRIYNKKASYIDYHIFSFTQLLYAIKEKLKNTFKNQTEWQEKKTLKL